MDMTKKRFRVLCNSNGAGMYYMHNKEFNTYEQALAYLKDKSYSGRLYAIVEVHAMVTIQTRTELTLL